jgi:hypothetical protein
MPAPQRLRSPEAPRVARTARWWVAGSGRNLIAGPVTSLRRLKREGGYAFFFPIPSHFLILSMSAMVRLYARAAIFAKTVAFASDVAARGFRRR